MDGRADEVWPFLYSGNSHHETNMSPFQSTPQPFEIQEHETYAFGETGTVFGPFKDELAAYDWFQADAQTSRMGWFAPDDFSVDPKYLGEATWCILTGRAYVDQLYVIAQGNGGPELDVWGKWSHKHGSASQAL